MTTFVRMIVALFLTTEMAWCQSNAADWVRVQTIETGRKIRVETQGKKHNGVFVNASDTEVHLTSGDGAQLVVPRSDVVRVYSQSKSHRTRNTLIGTAVGAAIGIVLYSTIGLLFRNEGGDDTGLLIVTPTAIGATAGAAILTGGMKKVYDAKKQ